MITKIAHLLGQAAQLPHSGDTTQQIRLMSRRLLLYASFDDKVDKCPNTKLMLNRNAFERLTSQNRRERNRAPGATASVVRSGFHQRALRPSARPNESRD
jgi:hypothetical protein